jgi:hypothetical protein
MVISSSQYVDTFGFEDLVGSMDYVVNSELIGAFTYHSFSVEHEASTKREDLIVKCHRGVAAATKVLVVGFIRHINPLLFHLV